MLKIERILYPTDFSACAGHALPHTLRLARELTAELHLLHALVLHEAEPSSAAYQVPSLETLYDTISEQTAALLHETASDMAGSDIAVQRAQVHAISPAAAILDYAAQHDIDLISMGTHGRRGLRRLLLGSVAEEVLRLAPCPVLTVPERETAGHEPGVANEIVIPLDFSEHALLALTYAEEFARMYASRIHLVHILDEAVYPDFYPPVIPAGGPKNEELREQSLERLREIAAPLEGRGFDVDAHVRSGRAAHQLADFAAEIQADLIAIASHGLTGLRHILLGSVTEQLVRRSPCPVLTVKAFGRQPVKR